jgi:hypothetical protein
MAKHLAPDGIRARALRGIKPDRSNDVLPPKDRRKTEPCGCGAQMVGRIDESNMHQGYMHWFWWCGGCGAVKDGGRWHPPTKEELAWDRWQKAQANG